MSNKIQNPNTKDSKRFVVGAHSAGMRLDKFLVEKLSGGFSRAKVQKAIEEGTWMVDGKKVPVHYFLKAGQRIEEVVGVAYMRPVQRVKEGGELSSTLNVIAETEDYVVIDKPAGIAVHPAPGIDEPTITELLVDQYPELYGVGEDPQRPGVVHRIDKLVSGVLVLARNQTAFAHLKQKFQSREVTKQYTALVYGTFVNDEGIIDLPLVRSTTKGKRGKIKALARGEEDAVPDAREAVTRYEVMERFPRFTLLRVFPDTGRTHQIRAHFAAIGHPIVGDPLYHGRTKHKTPFALTRPFLHAAAIAFTDRGGNVKTYQSSLPEELERVRTALSRKSQ